ncbi:hypothetical protein PybrP1_011701, partial [[Pythium] brassicae (nom. inval.)]
TEPVRPQRGSKHNGCPM